MSQEELIKMLEQIIERMLKIEANIENLITKMEKK